ncbi:UNVERIFIED_CONTAM: hypothetical protein FKN15_016206 [Acipenser sinensis]
MEAAHISPELPIRWVVSADRTVEIKEEVTELGCDQANERILQEETPPSSITERGTDIKLVYLGRGQASEMSSSHIKEETPELEPVPIKEESPVLEPVHIKKEVTALEPVHVKEETPELEPVHIKEASNVLESAEREHLSDRTVEIKEEVTELGCDQANERILQEETSPSSITERAANAVQQRSHFSQDLSSI